MSPLTMAMVTAAPAAHSSTPIPQTKPGINPMVYVGTLGVFLGAGISTLSGRLISVGLADLRGALGFGFDEAAWITTAFNMAQMFMGPFSVYLGGLLGVRRVLLFSGTVFIIASVLLPFSPSLGVMLFLQVVSGLSSGTFYPLTMSYALRFLPMRYTIYGIGVYSMDILAATSLAVPLEAWYVEHLSWRWLFWHSALATPLMMLCIHRAVPNPPPRPGPKPSLSWRGFLYASLGLSLLYGVLDQGERLDWLNSGVIVGMLASGIFLILASVIRRWASPNPLVNLPFLAHRNTLILAASLFSFRFVLLAIAFLIPSFLGAIQNYRALETGKVMTWVALPQLVMGFLTARLMKRVDGRLILALGFTTVALACLMNAQLTTAWASGNFWASQLVMAVGLSFAFVGMVGMFVQQAIDTGAISRPFDVLTYSSFIHMVRLFGGELGTATMQRLVAVREQFHSNVIGLHVEAGAWLTDERLRMLTGGMTPGSSGQEEAQRRAVTLLGGQVRQQAYALAIADGFITIAWVAVGIIVLIALMRKMKIFFDSPSMEAPG
jgi:MFS transporter, DHA2 family, multidrug resistance protein